MFSFRPVHGCLRSRSTHATCRFIMVFNGDRLPRYYTRFTLKQMRSQQRHGMLEPPAVRRAETVDQDGKLKILSALQTLLKRDSCPKPSFRSHRRSPHPNRVSDGGGGRRAAHPSGEPEASFHEARITAFHAFASCSCGQRKASLVRHMASKITASLRATATLAFLALFFFFNRKPQLFKG